MTGTTQTLTGTFGTTDFLMPLVLEDLTDEDARKRSRGEEGPSIAWMVGHLLHYRHYVMTLLGGEERDNPYAERFADAGATDGADYPTVAELREQWGATATDFQALLTSKTEAEFEKTSEGAHDERRGSAPSVPRNTKRSRKARKRRSSSTLRGRCTSIRAGMTSSKRRSK